MSLSVVTLGPIKFTGLGKPASMPIGGKQAIAMHKVPGGGRVLDAMGPDNADISWSGYLDGSDAGITARTLDKMRQSGQVVTLAWDVFSYQVLVAEFSCHTRHIPMQYKIICAVISDNSQVNVASFVSLDLLISSDLSNGNPGAAVSAATRAILGNALNLASSAVALSGAGTKGSSAYVAASGTVNAAAGAINSALVAAGEVLSPIGRMLASFSDGAPNEFDANDMSGQITTAVSACGDLANLSSSAGYVGRAAANLKEASA